MSYLLIGIFLVAFMLGYFIHTPSAKTLNPTPENAGKITYIDNSGMSEGVRSQLEERLRRLRATQPSVVQVPPINNNGHHEEHHEDHQGDEEHGEQDEREDSDEEQAHIEFQTYRDYISERSDQPRERGGDFHLPPRTERSDVYRPPGLQRDPLSSYLTQSALSSITVLKRQIRSCEQHINQLIDNGASTVAIHHRDADGEGTDDGVQDVEARIGRVVAKVEELNGNIQTLQRFADMPTDRAGQTAEQIRLDREHLRSVFDIIRHAYEFDIRHPAPAPRRRFFGDSAFVSQPNPFAGRSRNMDTISLLAALSGHRNNNIDGGRVEFGTFNLDPAGGRGTEQAMRELLQRMGAPASFWENIAVPMEAQTLSQIPSQKYETVALKKKESNKECNQECNICLTPFESNDMVRVFPCCELAQHTKCLEKWFETHDNCIVCRKKISEVLNPSAPAASSGNNNNAPSAASAPSAGPRRHQSSVQNRTGYPWSTPSLYQIFGDQIFGTSGGIAARTSAVPSGLASVAIGRSTETMELTDDEMPPLEEDVHSDGMDVD